jgi:hypothetical protein
MTHPPPPQPQLQPQPQPKPTTTLQPYPIYQTSSLPPPPPPLFLFLTHHDPPSVPRYMHACTHRSQNKVFPLPRLLAPLYTPTLHYSYGYSHNKLFFLLSVGGAARQDLQVVPGTVRPPLSLSRRAIRLGACWRCFAYLDGKKCQQRGGGGGVGVRCAGFFF